VRFAFLLPPVRPLNRLAEMTARAADHGFEMVYVPDQGFFRDPFVIMAQLGSRVEGIGLGLGVTTPYTRHPAQIARAAATLADFGPGRIVLGLGAGERANLRDRLGAPRTPVAPLLKETITVLRRLWAGERVSCSTAVFTLRDVALDFVPAAPVPIYIATTEPEGFRLAGEVADGLILGDMAAVEVVREAVKLKDAGARGAGRDPSDVAVVGWLTTIVTDDPAPARDRLRKVMASTVCGMHRAARQALGFDDQAIDGMRAAVAAGSVGASVLGDADLERLAVIGPAEQCVQRLRAVASGGVTQVVARMPAVVAARMDLEGNLARLAREVLPKV
jgi:5,10-methylenetetrahydromethanopterin reductase